METQTVKPFRDLTQTTLGVLFLIGLMATSLWILKPFLTALVWATMIVISTWPLLLRLEQRFGGKRGAATAVMTLGLLFLLIVPLCAAAATLISHMDSLSGWAQSLRTFEIPPPPDWVAGVPLVGKKAAAQWAEMAAQGREGLIARLTPYAGEAVHWLTGMLGSLGAMVLQFLLIVVISGLLYANGESAGGGVVRLDGTPLEYNARETILNPEFLAYGDRSRRWTDLL